MNKIAAVIFIILGLGCCAAAAAVFQKQKTAADSKQQAHSADAIYLRTSVRGFTKQKVEPEKLDRLLHAAMEAPSAGNEQPWEFYITENPDIMEKLSHADQYASPAANAPMVIVLCYNKNRLQYKDFPMIDMAVCAENLMIQAAALNLGTVFLSIAPLPERMKLVSSVLQLPDTIVPFVIIPVGYPSYETKQENRYDSSRIHTVK